MTDIWSEYGVYYDRLLISTDLYQHVQSVMAGELGPLESLPIGAKVLDLGAGTGNLTKRLASSDRKLFVVAVDNNDIMLRMVREKCAGLLCNDVRHPGVYVLNMDLDGEFSAIKTLDDNYDAAIFSNALNFLKNPLSALEQTYSVLKRGGQIRLCGPKRDSSVDILFHAIEKDLRRQGLFETLAEDFNAVYNTNKDGLARDLFRWSIEEVETMILDAGFSRILHSSDDVYADQSMLICAEK